MLLGQNKKPDIYKPNMEGDVPFKALPIKISYNGYDILQDSEILGIIGTSQPTGQPRTQGVCAAPEFTHYRLIVHIVVYRQRGFVPLHHFHRKFARDIFSPRCILSLYPYCVSSTRSRTLGWQLWVIE